MIAFRPDPIDSWESERIGSGIPLRAWVTERTLLIDVWVMPEGLGERRYWGEMGGRDYHDRQAEIEANRAQNAARFFHTLNESQRWVRRHSFVVGARSGLPVG